MYLFESLGLDRGVHKEGIYSGEDGRGRLKEMMLIGRLRLERLNKHTVLCAAEDKV